MKDKQNRWTEVCRLPRRCLSNPFWRDLIVSDSRKFEGIRIIIVSIIIYFPIYFFMMPLGHMNRLVGTGFYVGICLFWILMAFFG